VIHSIKPTKMELTPPSPPKMATPLPPPMYSPPTPPPTQVVQTSISAPAPPMNSMVVSSYAPPPPPMYAPSPVQVITPSPVTTPKAPHYVVADSRSALLQDIVKEHKLKPTLPVEKKTTLSPFAQILIHIMEVTHDPIDEEEDDDADDVFDDEWD